MGHNREPIKHTCPDIDNMKTVLQQIIDELKSPLATLQSDMNKYYYSGNNEAGDIINDRIQTINTIINIISDKREAYSPKF